MEEWLHNEVDTQKLDMLWKWQRQVLSGMIFSCIFHKSNCPDQIGFYDPYWNIATLLHYKLWYIDYIRWPFLCFGPHCIWGGLWGGCRMVELNVQDDVIKWKYLSVIGPFSQRPVTRSFYVFFDLRLNKWLSKQLRHWWFETRSLWCHCNMVSHIHINEMKADAHAIRYNSFMFQMFFFMPK